MILESVGVIALLLGFKYFDSVFEVKAQNDASDAISKHPKSEYVVMREAW